LPHLSLNHTQQYDFYEHHICQGHIFKLNRRKDDWNKAWTLGYSKLKTLPCQQCHKEATRYCRGCSDVENKRIVAFCADKNCQRLYHLLHFHFNWFSEEWYFVGVGDYAIQALEEEELDEDDVEEEDVDEEEMLVIDVSVSTSLAEISSISAINFERSTLSSGALKVTFNLIALSLE